MHMINSEYEINSLRREIDDLHAKFKIREQKKYEMEISKI